MGKLGSVADQFRSRLRAERERRGWSQGHLAERLESRIGVKIHATTIAKVEAGDRGVQIDELVGLAHIFGVSVDALIGSGSNTSDLMWAVSKLTENAQKAVFEIETMNRRLNGELQDVRHYAGGDASSVEGLISSATTACELLRASCVALGQLADEFPMPGLRA